MREPTPHVRNAGIRWAGGLLGALFLAIAGYLALQPGNGAGTWVAIVAIGGLGADALIAALRARRSLLMRIGPLP